MFPTHASIFRSEALEQQVLARYDLLQPVRCAFFRQGLNDTYLVETADQPYYLRIYRHNWRNQAQIEAEIAFLNDCLKADLPVSCPVPQRNGRYLTPVPAAEGTRYAVLFTAAPGQLHINPTPEQCHALGKVTGKMHQIADGLPNKIDRLVMEVSYFVERPFTNIQRIFGHLSQEMHLLTEATQTLTTRLSTLPTTALDYGLCHGDMHTGNVHFVDNSPTLFDFDCLAYGWRAYDLATFYWSRLLFEADGRQQQTCWRAFLAGHEAERPLAPTTLALIPTFTLARQLWVMGIHTDEVTTHYGRSWLNDKYIQKHFGFLQKLVGAASLPHL